MKEKPTISELDRARLEFEREKWQVEASLQREELALKREELARSRWINPLVIAVLAAAAAAFGNAGVTLISSYQQLKLEQERSTTTQKLNAEQAKEALRLEQTKSEAARILEVVKTNDPDKAAANLKFLIETGLIAEEGTRKEIQRYLQNREPGKGISLPTVQSGPPPVLPPIDDQAIICKLPPTVGDKAREAVIAALRDEPLSLTLGATSPLMLFNTSRHQSVVLPGLYERATVLGAITPDDLILSVHLLVSKQDTDQSSAYRAPTGEQLRSYLIAIVSRLGVQLTASLGSNVPCGFIR
ncbi:hypothetical protein M2232_003038 [Bradyrhizobium japonicum]|uniref:hypothetical protein n=1 Tax=Bradyrhizobium japonicum TaxID=375 RepID=UPI0022267201|nr:hypothetical protein [Bradyrhizobium japonicum]MCW2219506.1 hypothetical protein [Bradyrhizobium japonicum]MCW2344120.1 hypothetical protein [Bradyrhizobium japonicum]